MTTKPLYPQACAHVGALGHCFPRVADGRCIWCERPLPLDWLDTVRAAEAHAFEQFGRAVERSARRAELAELRAAEFFLEREQRAHEQTAAELEALNRRYDRLAAELRSKTEEAARWKLRAEDLRRAVAYKRNETTGGIDALEQFLRAIDRAALRDRYEEAAARLLREEQAKRQAVAELDAAREELRELFNLEHADHAKTRADLEAERAAHAATKRRLERYEEAAARLLREEQAKRQAVAASAATEEAEWARAVEALGAELDAERTAHAAERTAHAVTKRRLERYRRALHLRRKLAVSKACKSCGKLAEFCDWDRYRGCCPDCTHAPRTPATPTRPVENRPAAQAAPGTPVEPCTPEPERANSATACACFDAEGRRCRGAAVPGTSYCAACLVTCAEPCAPLGSTSAPARAGATPATRSGAHPSSTAQPVTRRARSGSLESVEVKRAASRSPTLKRRAGKVRPGRNTDAGSEALSAGVGPARGKETKNSEKQRKKSPERGSDGASCAGRILPATSRKSRKQARKRG